VEQLVVFTLDKEEYGLPISQVQEIIRHMEPRTVPSAPHSIQGVINLRSKIIPVCHLQQALGLGGWSGDGQVDSKIVILESRSGTVGLIVDEVNEVLTVTEEQIDPADSAHGEYVRGIAKVGERLLVLLDPDAMFASLGIAANAIAA
jgi:purine-binding chemotaxis protein CheW